MRKVVLSFDSAATLECSGQSWFSAGSGSFVRTVYLPGVEVDGRAV